MAYIGTLTPDADLLMPDPKWSPVYWTPMKSKMSLGDDIVEFMENFLTPPRLYQDDWKVLDWQRWLLRHMFELDAFGLLRYRTFLLEVPRKAGKSFLASAILTYFLVKADDGDQFFCAAAAAKQAHVVFDEVTRNIKNSPLLQRMLKTMSTSIHSNVVNAVLRLLTFSAGSNHGLGSMITMGDELHAWDGVTGASKRGRDLLQALRTGSKDRPESMFIGITTAGSNLNGVAYELHEYGMAIASGKVEDDSFGFACWMAEDDDDLYDPATWRKANPNIGEGLMKEEEFANDLKMAEATGTADFERFYLNRWIDYKEQEGFINLVYLADAYKEIPTIPPGAAITVGIDASTVDDATAIVGIDLMTGLILPLWVKEKKVGQTDFFVHEEEIDSAMEQIFAHYDVKKLYCDPAKVSTLVRKWIRKWGRGIVRDIPQSAVRMAPMGAEFRQDLYSKVIAHNNNPQLLTHFRNAVESQNGMARKESKKSDSKIDILVASILANGARRELMDKLAIQQSQYPGGLPF